MTMSEIVAGIIVATILFSMLASMIMLGWEISEYIRLKHKRRNKK